MISNLHDFFEVAFGSQENNEIITLDLSGWNFFLGSAMQSYKNKFIYCKGFKILQTNNTHRKIVNT
jgi:hypothetical protein